MTLDDPAKYRMIRSKKPFESPILNLEVLNELAPVRPQDPHCLLDSRYTLRFSSTSAEMPLLMPSRLLPGAKRRSRFSLVFFTEPAPEVRASDIFPCLQQNIKRGVPVPSRVD